MLGQVILVYPPARRLRLGQGSRLEYGTSGSPLSWLEVPCGGQAAASPRARKNEVMQDWNLAGPATLLEFLLGA